MAEERSNLNYVANGEIGLVVRTIKDLDCLDVAFSTQPEVTYRYYRNQVNENLELAYALTVHKAQGGGSTSCSWSCPRTPRCSHGSCSTPG